MAIGAMLCGVAWRAGDGPLVPPIATMIGAAFALALSTMIGQLTGQWTWLHLLALCTVCLTAGCLTVIGRPGNLIGTQSLIAFIVFGRVPAGFGAALGSAGLVAAGAAAQIVFALLVAVPVAWRRQRSAVADSYEALAHLAGEILERSAATAAGSLDQADSILSTPALFADPKRRALNDLVEEGRRIRLELIVLGTALLREHRVGDAGLDALSSRMSDALSRPRRVLSLTAVVVRDGVHGADQLDSARRELRTWDEERTPLDDSWLEERLQALVGQVRAAARLAATLEVDRIPELAPQGRPSLGSGSWRHRVLFDLRRIRESATLQSAAGRHAVRLAVVVTGTSLLVERWGSLPHGYWAVVAAATVLRPEFAATFTRGAERVLGTAAGVVISTLIAVAINPGGWGVVVVVALLAWATYAVFPASFTLGVAGLTGVIVFLLHIVYPDSIQIALYRGLDTLIGGAIGLAAYALWPTWSAMSTGRLLGTLADAQRAYLATVTGALVDGRALEDRVVKPLARAARVAWTDAAAAVGLAQAEPPRGATDPRRFANALGALRRIVWSVHALRLEASTLEDRQPLPALEPLADALDDSLTTIARGIQGEATSGLLPPLRRLYREVDRQGPERYRLTLEPPIDELIDAIDTAAAAIGLDLP